MSGSKIITILHSNMSCTVTYLLFLFFFLFFAKETYAIQVCTSYCDGYGSAVREAAKCVTNYQTGGFSCSIYDEYVSALCTSQASMGGACGASYTATRTGSCGCVINGGSCTTWCDIYESKIPCPTYSQCEEIPPPTSPTPTPTPPPGSTPPPPPPCPNGFCSGSETCLTCPADCGACPPTPPPPTPTPACANNWWGASGTICRGPYPTEAACQAAAGSCQCGACPPGTNNPRGTKGFIVFEDKNQNGVWDYNSGEPRISVGSAASCPGTNTIYASGFSINFNGWDMSPDENCNIDGSENTTNHCTGSVSCPPGGGCSGVGSGGWDVLKTCLDWESCSAGQCRAEVLGGGCKSAANTTVGALCNVRGGDYCNDVSLGTLKNGPFVKRGAAANTYLTTLSLPTGWSSSAGSPNPRNVSVVGSTGDARGACEYNVSDPNGGLIAFGVVRTPLATPTNMNATCNAGGSTVTLSWNNVTGAVGYMLRINHEDRCLDGGGNQVPWYCPSTSSCVASYSPGVCADEIIHAESDGRCSTSGGTTQCTVAIRPDELYPDWTVQAKTSGESYPYGSPAGTGPAFTCAAAGDITGSVYLDESGTATPSLGNCTGSMAQKVVMGTATLSGGYGSQSVNGSGDFTFSSVSFSPPSYTLTLSNLLPGFYFTCPAGGVFTVNSPNNTNPARYFISPTRGAWFQAMGGSVGAEAGSGLALSSQVPPSCTGSCVPQVIRLNSSGTADSDGYAVTGEGGTIDTSTDVGEQLDNLRTTPDVYAQSGRVAPREGYAYFYRLYSMGVSPQSDFSNLDDIQKPTGAPINTDREAYFANGNARISAPWSVGSTDSIVVFVNGNLTIANTVDVQPGGFVAFIVAGSITIDPVVGTATATSTTQQVEGVYIADGVLWTGESSLKFVGGGVFAGWSGVILQRNYGDSLNNTAPAELFIARPDIVFATPDRMRDPNYQWLEVAP